jgi:uncharacterized protein
MRSSIRTYTMLMAALILAGIAGFVPAWAGGPSFDCRRAILPAEKAICTNPRLSAIDLLVSKSFKGFEPAFGGDKRKIARGLVADRDDCKDDVACIVSAQNNALQTYGSAPSWVQDYNVALIGKKALETASRVPRGVDQPLPQSIGQCGLTHLKTLTTRLGDDPLDTASPDAGSAATFTNGGTAVSYDREPGLASSKVGDLAVMCLMSIPRDCPEGDDRGKVYYGLDLAAKGSWALPDSEHLCGGA